MVILHAQAPIKPEARERWLEILDAVTPPRAPRTPARAT
jgi:hypothetical protein